MQPKQIHLTVLATFFATLSIDSGLSILRLTSGAALESKHPNSSVLAQTSNPGKAKADQLFEQGKKQLDTSQFQAALASFQQALRNYREIKERTGEAESLNKLGEVYRHLGQFPTALRHHESALVIMRELSNRAGEGATLHNIASVYENQGQYENALKFYQQALSIQREVKDRDGEAATLIGLGNTYIYSKRYRNAFEDGNQDLKPYQDAIKSYEQALVIMREIGDRAGEGWSLNGLGISYMTLDKREDGIKFYDRALAIMREIGNRAGEATVLLNLGRAYDAKIDPIRQNRYVSLDYYEPALKIAREIGYRPLEAEILNRIGFTYVWGGEREKPLEFYQQALAVVREVGHRPLEAIVLTNLSRIYNGLGQIQTAREYSQQALAIRREIGVQTETRTWEGGTLITYRTSRNPFTLVTRLEAEGLIHYQSGEAHARQERYQPALASYQQALAIVRQQENRPWEWVILNQMGKIYERLGQHQVALENYQQSLVIRREIDKLAQQKPIPYTIRVADGIPVNVTRNVKPGNIKIEEAIASGAIALGTGDPIANPITITEGLVVYAALREPEIYAENEEEETLTNIGNIYQILGNSQAALKAYQEALAIIGEETKGEHHKQGQIVLTQMGAVYEQLGQYQTALASYQQALQIANKESNINPQIPILLSKIGKAYEKLGQYETAIESYQQALANARQYRETYRSDAENFRRVGVIYELPDEEAILNNIGAIYEQLGQTQKAQEYRQQALELRREIGDRAQEEVTKGKAILITEIGKNEKGKTIVQVNKLEGEVAVLLATIHTDNQAALQSYQQALAIVRQQKNRPWEAEILYQMGLVYEKLGQNQAALEAYRQALQIRQEVDNLGQAKATLVRSVRFGTDYLIEIRADSGQVTTFNHAGGAIVFAPEKEEILIETGNAYKALGQHQAALESYQQALAIVRQDEGKRYLTEGEILDRIASVYDNLQYDAALTAYQELLASARQKNNRAEEGRTLNSIGTVYKNLGRYQSALTSYQEALAIVQEMKLRSPNANMNNFEGAILNNIGTVYEQLGQYPTALESYQKALTIVQDLSWRETTLINIGSAYEKMAQYPAALEFYDRALAVARGVSDRPTEGITLIHQGKVYQKIGQHQTALESYQQALAILQEVGNRPGEGWVLNNLGEVYSDLKQHQTAREYYQQALAIREEVGDKAGKGITLKNIGVTLQEQNQPELAIVFYKQSVNITEEIRKDIQGLSKEQQGSYTETVAGTYRNLADLLLKQNRVLEAQQVLDLLKVQELEDYLRNVRGNEQTGQGIPNNPPEQEIKQGYEELINKAIQIGKERTQIEKINTANRTPDQQKRLLELRKTEQEITQQFAEFLKSPAVNSAVAQLKQVTGGESLDLKDFNSLRDNLQRLQQNAVVLYPLILDDRLELILVTAYSPPIRRTVNIKREQLNQAILEVRKSLTNPISNAKIPTRQLYELLIKPIENDLSQANAKTIIYAPDGQLRYIPIAALYDGKQWLIERFRINNITAASLTDFNTKPQEKLQVLAGAFTQGSYNFKVGERNFSLSGLPFAGREVENLAAILPDTTKLLDQKFNRDIILLMNDYSVVHLATHAEFVAGQPENSFILLGNGEKITLRDIESWSLPKVDLFVLSACQTAVGGMGNGQEILGFGYQIQRTGARAAIASLWSVDDGGTQRLMDAFYSVMSRGNITKAEALRQAQIALIAGNYSTITQQRGLASEAIINSSPAPQAQHQLSHPYYWAPFILIGNGL
ncbi:MAG TPA: tetratricopeptide repeat protein [Leptolyngbyaceae cyanobacterium]